MSDRQPDIQRAPPHSMDAEQGVLGSMLIDRQAIEEAREKLADKEAFFITAHQTIFIYLCAALESGMPVDLITFTQALRDAGELDAVGGAQFVTSLFTFVPTAANIGYYIEIVREKWILRELIAQSTETVRRAFEEQDDVNGLLAESQSKIIEIGQLSSTAEALHHISEAVPEVVASIEATYHGRGKPLGISTGFVDLDRMCGGFQVAKTYYIGARPAMGKSSLGTEFAEHAAIDAAEKNKPVAIFSVEMTEHELTEVILCRRSQVNLVRLRDGMFSKEGHEKLLAEAEALKTAPIYIDDTANLSIFAFRARARRAVMKFAVKLIIIDYVQRMKSTSKRAQGNREQEINEIAMGISETAKELKVPIVVLAQLNRKNEERADKTPELSDFRESGSLEQEAHLVGLLHRPSYYCRSDLKLSEQAEKYKMTVEEFKELTELIIAKQRRGPVGTIKLRFIKEYAQFQSEDEERPLFSNRADERQQKPAAQSSTVLAQNQELRMAQEVFPNATEIEP